MDTESAWKNRKVVEKFVEARRNAIPNSIDQLMVMMKLLQHNEKKIERFVDLGAGDGILSHLILEKYAKARGVLIDFSEPMIEAASKRLVKYSERLDILKGDLSNPDWQKAVFKDRINEADAIVSGYCIHHLSHERKLELYSEIYNRLSQNGIFINIEHVASNSDWGERLADESFIDAISIYEETLTKKRTREQIARDFHNREDKKDNILLSTEKQTQWLREIGFKRVDIYFKSYDLAVFAGTRI